MAENNFKIENNLSNNDIGIVGRIPGYNKNIDQTGIFEKQLLSGLTFIDLIPNTYNFALFNKTADAAKDLDYYDALVNRTEGVITRDYIYSQGTQASTTKITEVFNGALQKMKEGLDLPNNYKSDIKMLRIIAANDSTFNQNLSTQMGKEASFMGIIKNSKIFAKASQMVSGGFISNSPGKAIDIFSTSVSNDTKSVFSEILAGKLSGATFSSPKAWSDSSYNSSLTVMLKLISPTGDPDSIKRNILQPLSYLIAAASPITQKGIVYGYPFMWDVRARGIARFKLGYIANISLNSGTFETTYNIKLQPTIIEVRLTISPLIQDFSSQIKIKNSTSTIVGNKEEVVDEVNIYSGEKTSIEAVNSMNFGDIVTGMMNVKPGKNLSANDAEDIIEIINL